MMIALDALKKLNINVEIQFNNRKFLYGLLQQFQVLEDGVIRVILVIDKIEKISVESMMNELTELGLSPNSLAQIKDFIDLKGQLTMQSFRQWAGENRYLQEGLQELAELMMYLEALEIEALCIFNPFLARGLEMHTGTIYEMFLRDGMIRSSIGSGGRYDNAIGGLLNSEKTFATVGSSFGLDVIYCALETLPCMKHKAMIDIYVIPIGTVKEALKLATSLRAGGKRVEVDLSNKRVKKAMERANREGIANVIVLGNSEVTNGTYFMKNMQTGESEEMFYRFD